MLEEAAAPSLDTWEQSKPQGNSIKKQAPSTGALGLLILSTEGQDKPWPCTALNLQHFNCFICKRSMILAERNGARTKQYAQSPPCNTYCTC